MGKNNPFHCYTMSLLLFAALAVATVVRPDREAAFRKWASDRKSCESFGSSMFNPMRCKNENLDAEVASFAADFKAKRNIQASDLEPVIFVPGFAASGLDG